MSDQKETISFGRTILVVDDNVANLRVITQCLEEEDDCRVLTARNGKSALEKAKHGRPDLILLDVMMPEMDGFETCRRLKADRELQNIPVIFMTVLAGLDEKVRAFRLGAVDYVTKPFQAEEVLARVRTHLRLRELTECLEEKVRRRTMRLEQQIAERERMEEALRRTTRAYKALSNCNQAVVHAKNETELMRQVCGIIQKDCGYHLVWIGIVQKDKTIRLVSRAGLGEDCPDPENITWKDGGKGLEPTGTAIRTGKSVITRDIRTNPDFEVCSGENLGQGYASSAAFPFFENEQVIGALNIHAKHADAFKKEEVDLLTELAGDLSYGIASLRMREKQRLAEERLRQAQKMEAIGTLAGGIAHDFNNILGVIIGQAELIEAIDLPEDEAKPRQRLRELLEASYRARDLVKQILTISRKKEDRKQVVKIDSVVKEAIKFLRASIPSTIEIRSRIETDGAVCCDSTHIHQIVMNLCTNASHAMKEKGGVLDVSLLDRETWGKFAGQTDFEPGPYIELRVADTGNGMNRETLSKIFDPYFTTKAKGEGTGLGLAVVHGIVKSIGGHVTVDSEIGKGSVFKVCLPRIDLEAPEAEKKGTVRGGKEQILFVDDEETLLNTISEMLKRLGYDVTSVSDSADALEMFKTEPDRFDLVITDLTMPRMTGIDLSREILAIRPDMPIILCSGFIEEKRKEQAESLGVRAVAIKPLSLEDLAETITNALGRMESRTFESEPPNSRRPKSSERKSSLLPV